MHVDEIGIHAGGGTGGAHASVGGAGGTGGNIVLTASAGGVFMGAEDPDRELHGASVGAEGGTGGDTTGLAATARGGAGGAGGTIRIVAANSSELLGTLSTRGGDGGYAPGAGSLAVGGAGGAGGAISATLSAPAATLTLGGGVFAGGALGGRAADLDTTDDLRLGQHRSGARRCGRSDQHVLGVGGGRSPGARGARPADARSVERRRVCLPQHGGQVDQSGTLVLDPGAWVRNTEPFTNNGTVQLGSGSLLSLGTYDQALQTFVPGGVTFTNARHGRAAGHRHAAGQRLERRHAVARRHERRRRPLHGCRRPGAAADQQAAPRRCTQRARDGRRHLRPAGGDRQPDARGRPAGERRAGGGPATRAGTHRRAGPRGSVDAAGVRGRAVGASRADHGDERHCRQRFRDRHRAAGRTAAGDAERRRCAPAAVCGGSAAAGAATAGTRAGAGADSGSGRWCSRCCRTTC